MAKFTPILRYGVLVISALTIVGSLFYSREVFAAKFTTPPGSTANTAWQDIRSDVIISGNVGVGTTVAPSNPGLTVTNGGALRFDQRTGLVSNTNSAPNLEMAIRPYTTSNYWQIASNNGLIVTDRNSTSPSPKGLLYYDASGFGIKTPDDQWRVRTFTGGQELSGTTYANTIQSANYYDRDNNNYYLDPAGVSMMNQVQAASLYSSITGTWLPWPTNNWNYIRGATQAFNQPWYDETNGAYYIDPSNGSQFNTLNANALYDANRRVAVSNGYGQNYVDFASYNVTNPAPNNNFNDITQSGLYQGYESTGRPAAGHYSILHSEYPDGTHNWFQQLGFSFYNNSVFYRIKAGGTYTSWARFLMSGDPIYVDSVQASNNISGGNITCHECYTNNWYRVNTQGGLYWQIYGGGLYMTDSTWIRAYNNKSFYTNQIMRADAGLQTAGVQVSNNVYAWGSGRQCLGCADSVAGNPNLWLIANSGHIAFRDNNCPGPGGINNYGNCYAKFDVAELYPSNQQLSAGDVVSIGIENTKVELSDAKRSNKAIGVVSTNPAVLIDGSGLITGYINSLDGVNKTTDPIEKKALTDIYESNKGKFPIALSGRIPVKVSSENGSIGFGDAISVSDINGFGAKSVQAGSVVGKAMSEFKITGGGVEGYQCTNVQSVESINWPIVKDTDDRENLMKSCFKLPDGTYVGKVMMFVNTSTYDPDTYLTSTNGVQINGQQVSLAGNVVTKIQLMAEAVVGRLQAGIVETKQLIVNGVDVMQRMSEMQTKIDQQDQEIKQLKQAVQELQTNN